MIVGIMQPYFLPYPGYFNLIAQCDKWVVFDTPQYIRHGWVNRNRILHPTKEWQYIGVPLVKHKRDTAIRDIRISNNTDWSGKILLQLEHYKKKAPYYKDTVEFLADCFAEKSESLVDLNIALMQRICAILAIEFDYSVASRLDVDPNKIHGPGDWALVIAEMLGASEYINPPGGEHLFDKAAFAAAGIELTIQQYENMRYPCPGYEYFPGLSIIDAMMWNKPEQIRDHIRANT